MYMNLKHFIMIIIFTSSVAAHSSNIKCLQIGIKTGYNYTIPIFSNYNLAKKPKIHYCPKFQSGLSGDFILNKKLSIITEVLYEKRFSYLSKIDAYGPEIYPFAFKLNYSLISLPILLKARSKLPFPLYFLFGIRFEHIFEAVEDFADVGGFYRHEDVSNKMPKITYGIDIGLGKDISTWKIVISPEIRYILEIRSGPPAEYFYPVINNIFTNHSFLFNLGIAYKFLPDHHK